MPNYCENDLAVEGPKEVIEELTRLILIGSSRTPRSFNGWTKSPKPGTGRTRGGLITIAARGRRAASTRAAMTGASRLGAQMARVSRRAGRAGDRLRREDAGGGLSLRYGLEPAQAGHREGGGTLPGAAVRTPLFRVRLLFQRAVLLQRGRGRDRQQRPIFRRPRRLSGAGQGRGKFPPASRQRRR